MIIVSLALGIALTIGLVAVLAIFARQIAGAALAAYLPDLDLWTRIFQGVAGVLVFALGVRMAV